VGIYCGIDLYNRDFIDKNLSDAEDGDGD